MKKTFLMLFIIGLILALINIGFVQAEEKTIKIGLSLPITGPIPYIGEFALKASKMAIDEVNNEGGIAGRKVKLIIYDNECSPEKATSIAERLIFRDKVDVIRGAVCSGASLATLVVIEREKIPFTIAISSSMKIKEVIGVGGNEWGFRFNIDDEHRAIGNAYQLIKLLNAKKLVFFGLNDDCGRAGGMAYKKWVPRIGGKLVLDEYFDPEAEDFMGFLTKYKRMDIDGLIILGAIRQTAPILRQAHSIGLDDKIRIAATAGGLCPKTIELVGKEVCAGKVAAISWTPEIPNPLNKVFVQKFKKRYGETPIMDAAQTYVTTKLTIEAIRRAIKETGELTPTSLREALELTDMETAFGRIRFNLHHQAFQDLYVTEVNKEGQIEIIETIPAQTLIDLTTE